jgi:hypothetical protein
MSLLDDRGAEDDENDEDDGGGYHGFGFGLLVKFRGDEEIRRGIRRSDAQG